MRKLSDIPGPSKKRVAARVSLAAERAIKDGHPWLFADSILKQSHVGETGDFAVIFDRKNRFLAIGLLDTTSPIRVRILHKGQPTLIDEEWFTSKLRAANKIRADIDVNKTNGYRIVHGENDGLPGLVIDRYDEILVLKIYSLAWIPHLRSFVKSVMSLFKPKCLVLRLSRLVQGKAKAIYELEDGDVLSGLALDNPVIFQENGLWFEADVVQGQKTGFFLDQRENRAKVEELALGKSVLNVFAYTGGFSLYAARGGAKQVTSLDLSKPALAAAVRNFRLNGGDRRINKANHETVQGDAFSLLERFKSRGRRFDMVIVDPPAFAKSKAEIPRALEAYRYLTILALGVLQPDGVLVTASCSSRVSEKEFFGIVHGAANSIQRPLSEIERTGHPIDHPIGFPEGAYLKCLFSRVQ